MSLLPVLGDALSSFPRRLRPYNNITPFTYQDGLTYLETLEELRRWLAEGLIGHLDDEFKKLIAEYDAATDALKIEMDRYTAAIREDRAAFESATAAAQQAFETVVERAESLITAASKHVDDGVAAAQLSAEEAERWNAATQALQDLAVVTLINNSATVGTAIDSFLTNARKRGSQRVIYFKDYCALDGVTDDTANAKLAIAAAGDGGTIMLEGTLLISSTLTMGKNQSWRGLNQSATIKPKAGAAFNLVTHNDTTSSYDIRDIIFDGSKAIMTGATDTVGVPLNMQAARKDRTSRISNVTVVDSPTFGARIRALVIDDAYPVEITGSAFLRSTRPGLLLQFVNPIFDRNTVSNGLAEGVYFYQCDRARVTRNITNDNVWHGITVAYSSNFKVSDNASNGNGAMTGGNAGACGIAIGGGVVGLPVNTHYSVANNTCVGNQGVGIQLDPTVSGSGGRTENQYATVTGNVVKDTVLNHGIYVQNGAFITITGNTCTNNGRDGVTVNGQYCTVDGNNLSGNKRYGLNLSGVIDAVAKGEHRIGVNNLENSGTNKLFVFSGLANVQMPTMIAAPTGGTN